MKRKTIILLSSVLAGSLLVGGAFATYFVTDLAQPKVIDITPGQAPAEDVYVTLEWGKQTNYTAEFDEIEANKYYKAGYFVIKSDFAYNGIFSVKMQNTTIGKLEGEDMFDHIKLYAYQGDVDLEEEAIPSTAVPFTFEDPEEGEGVVTYSQLVATTSEGVGITIFYRLECTDDQFAEMANDHVRLTVDWNMGPDSEPAAIPDYCIWGTTNGTTWGSLGTLVAKDESEYMIESIQLAKDTEFTIHMNGDTYREFSDVKPASPAYADFKQKGGTEEISQNNLVVVNDGTYDIYVKIVPDDNGDYIWLVKKETPVVVTYTATKDGQPFELGTYSGDYGENKAVFTASLTEGNKLVIFKDNEALPLGDSQDTEYTAPSTGNYTIYVNKDYKVYYAAPSQLVEINVVLGDYATANAVCFVNYWGGNAGAGYAKVENSKASIDSSATGLLVVRCDPAKTTDTVIWEGDARNVWNQSEDLDIGEGDLAKTLTFKGWGDPNPKDTFEWK